MAVSTDVCSQTVVNLKKVRQVKNRLPGETEILAMAEIFKVLGDPTRIRIVMALSIEELCVCDLATLIGLSVSAISHQLRVLRNLKLVKYRREGKMVYYSLDDHHIDLLIAQAREHVNEPV